MYADCTKHISGPHAAYRLKISDLIVNLNMEIVKTLNWAAIRN
jgi:hypothetical protein